MAGRRPVKSPGLCPRGSIPSCPTARAPSEDPVLRRPSGGSASERRDRGPASARGTSSTAEQPALNRSIRVRPPGALPAPRPARDATGEVRPAPAPGSPRLPSLFREHTGLVQRRGRVALNHEVGVRLPGPVPRHPSGGGGRSLTIGGRGAVSRPPHVTPALRLADELGRRRAGLRARLGGLRRGDRAEVCPLGRDPSRRRGSIPPGHPTARSAERARAPGARCVGR